MQPRRRPGAKFRRASAPVRREALIAATLASLRRFGHDGISVRRISAQAGVSPGLINHHFPSSTSLLAAAYEAIAESLLQSVRRHADDVTLAPRERLRRFFEASFAPEQIDPGVFHSWLVFWSMVGHDAEMRAVHERTYGAYRTVLEQLLGELRREARVPAFRLRDAALGLGAMLDGLWLEASLFPATFKPSVAVRLCEDWTTALCAGAFPNLLAAARRTGTE